MSEDIEVIEDIVESEEIEEAQDSFEPATVAAMPEFVDELQLIEGALFASSAPLSIDKIAKTFPESLRPKSEVIKKHLVELQARYEGRGIELVEVASGFRFQVAAAVAPFIAEHREEKPARFSRALLETLSLIAYRQPITRGEIEEIRGVVVSTYIMKTLDELGWVRIVGHKDVPGRPGLYATSKGFLDYFGLKSLEDLPPLVALQDLNAAEELLQSNIAEMAEVDAQAELDNETEEEIEIEAEASDEPIAASEEADDDLEEVDQDFIDEIQAELDDLFETESEGPNAY